MLAALIVALALGAVALGCGDHHDGESVLPGSVETLAAARVRAVVEAYITAFNTRDRALYVSLFADDGTVEDPVGSKVIRGRQALGDFFDAATASGALTIELLPNAVRVAGNHVAFYFRVRVDTGGQTLELRPIDTFDLDADGRIRAMRAYWSPGDFEVVP
jgi:steroid Delta-isomerase